MLRVDRIGIHDDFFHLGGHPCSPPGSPSGCARSSAAVAVRTLFEQPTVARLAVAVEDRLMAEIAAMSDEDVEQALKEQRA
ncbi:hypothetical protein V2I01_32770 [Micromonospora sp. BRA006-A]|nr:hypothetical protein [Micromonospora sp. BRA006-A]